MSQTLTLRPHAPRSFLARVKDAVRSFTVDPVGLQNRLINRILSDAQPTYAGIPVNYESALTFSAVYDAVNQISSDVAKLPLNLHKRLKEGGSDVYHDSKVHKLLKYEPNPEMGSMVFRRTLTAHALLSTGGFAEIQRNGAGQPMALWPITPDRVKPTREKRGNTQSGPLVYEIDGGATVIPARDMIHIHGLGYDGYVGYSLVTKARQAIALALAAEKFGAEFFQSGSSLGGILMNKGLLTDDETEEQIRSAISKHQSDAAKLRQFLVLMEGDWHFERTGVTPSESQMNDLRSKQVEEVARFFNMPVHKLKDLDRATNNNIEQQDLEYYKGCLLTWLTLEEEEYNRKLIAPLERGQQFFKHNANAFLRGDIQSRFTAFGIARDKGIINADEWRDKEDMNPQPGGQGKLFLVQSAQVPVDQLVALVQSQIKKNETPPPTPAPPAGGSPKADAERALDDALARAATAQQVADAARQEAAAEREARIALEASGAATAAELSERRATEAAALTRHGVLEQLAAERQADADAMRSARDAALAAADAANLTRAQAEAKATNAETLAGEATEARLEAERKQQAAELVAREAEAVAEKRATEAARLQAEYDTLKGAADADAVALAEVRNALATAEAKSADAAEARERADTALRAATENAKDAERRESTLTTDLEQLRAQLADVTSHAETLAIEKAEALESANAATEHARAIADEKRTADAVAVDLALQLEAVQAQLHTAREKAEAALIAQQLAESDTAKAEQAATDRAEALARETAAREAAERQTAEIRKAEDARRAAIMAAHRAAVVDVMRRMIDREAERARRASISPDKFRAWLDSFYPSYEALCIEALRPAIAVHTAWMGQPDTTDAVVRMLVAQHVNESRVAWQAILDDTETRDLGSAVNAVLHGWDRDRADQVANVVLQREIDHASGR